MERAYSVWSVKALDAEQRIITGIASTPEPDRVGDIMDPLGATFAAKLPLLLYHDRTMPVGTVTFDAPTPQGITFKAHIPEIADAGPLKDRIDTAWQSIKAGILTGVSIGFRALKKDIEFLKEGFTKFKRFEIVELSLVTVPANASTMIQSIKQYEAVIEGVKGVSPGDISTKTAPVATAWSAPALKDFTDQPWGELSAEYRTRVAKHYAWAAEMPPAAFGDLKFPHHRASDGAVVWNAVVNAAARLDQANIPDADKAKVRAHLARHYRQFDQTPPWEGKALTDDPAAPGTGSRVITTAGAAALTRTGSSMKPIAEQIASWEATRTEKDAKMTALMDGWGDTLPEPAQKEEYETLRNEVKDIDAHLVLLKERQVQNQQAATVVDGKTAATATSSRGNGHEPTTQITMIQPKLDPGIRFTRLAMALAASRGSRLEAAEYAKRWEHSSPEIALVCKALVRAENIGQWYQATTQAAYAAGVRFGEKAAVTAGTTTDSDWAAPLVVFQNLASEFLEYLRPGTIIGRIPGFRRVPFNITVPTQTSPSTVNWVGQAKPKPVSELAFGQATLGMAKIAGIVVVSEELARSSAPSVEGIIRTDLANSVTQFMDRQFVDPTVVEVANVSPASVTNGASVVNATGTTGDDFISDAKSLFELFIGANLSVAGAVWIMSESQALALSLLLNALGQRMFPDITMTGGTLLGLPVIASQNVPAESGSPAGGRIILARPGDILLADDGGVTVDVSREASLQMDSAPTDPPTASTVMVSLWQMNMVGLKVERFINWKKARAAAVAYINGANYGA